MSDAALYFAAHFLLVIVGLPVAFVSGVREFSFAARISAAFGAGALAVTVAAIVFSAVRIPLSMLTIGVPLTTLSIISVVAYASSIKKKEREGQKERESKKVRHAHARHYASATLAFALALAAVVHLFLFYWTSRGTSMDFLFFWGVKGVRFADAQAIDPELLRWQFSLMQFRSTRRSFP